MAKTTTTDPAATIAKTGTASAKAQAEKREFTVTRDVLHDGELLADGESVELTKTQHAQLFAVGAVSEAWTE
jgi:hypothetical protein